MSATVTAHPLSPPRAAVVSQIRSFLALPGRGRAPPVPADVDAHRPAPVVPVIAGHARGALGGGVVAVHVGVNFCEGVVEDGEAVAGRVVAALQAHLLQRGGEVLALDCLPHSTAQTFPVRHLVSAGRLCSRQQVGTATSWRGKMMCRQGMSKAIVGARRPDQKRSTVWASFWANGLRVRPCVSASLFVHMHICPSDNPPSRSANTQTLLEVKSRYPHTPHPSQVLPCPSPPTVPRVRVRSAAHGFVATRAVFAKAIHACIDVGICTDVVCKRKAGR